MNIPTCITHEPSEQYHAKAKDYLSSHRLGDFRKCPLLYFKKQEGLIPDHDSPAYLEGRAAHSLILEGRAAYEAEFVTDAQAPVNPRTGKSFGPTSDKYKEWADGQDKEVITADIAARVEAMNASVRSHEHASRLLATGVAEGVVRRSCLGMPCQIRMDWFNANENALCDLKTTDDLSFFEYDAKRYGYPWQIAFYRAVLAAALECSVTDIPCYLIAVEKKEPFRCGVWLLDPDMLAVCQAENEQAMERLCESRRSGIWQTGYEELRTMAVL